MEFLEKVEQSGKWLQQACTTMFFFIPKNVTSERPIALIYADVDTLVGSFESTWSGEVAAEVPHGLGRHGWQKRRSTANSVGSNDGNGEILWKSKGRRSRSGGVGILLPRKIRSKTFSRGSWKRKASRKTGPVAAGISSQRALGASEVLQ